MSKQLFDVDRFSGIIEHIGKNDKGNTIIQRSQDTRAILGANRQEMASQVDGNWKGDMHKVASIPLIVVDQWREEMKIAGYHNCDPLASDNRAFLIAKINSSEWSGIRTKQGRV
tara:strand:+ start:2114 stop:2455 length:342 start_codon:yes stop_codon:yes gene_type:complete